MALGLSGALGHTQTARNRWYMLDQAAFSKSAALRVFFACHGLAVLSFGFQGGWFWWFRILSWGEGFGLEVWIFGAPPTKVLKNLDAADLVTVSEGEAFPCLGLWESGSYTVEVPCQEWGLHSGFGWNKSPKFQEQKTILH